ncbi:hypothetical protein JDV02_000223 [Purpureocillium takamizusanense]|uniref:Uncharacterized protein n=1 Tax=Purpureocillium takamizusanense TaxID=2060973 RepID=A0A9Q8Q5P6_9HYPO|nr:uncharacterized protein JDV02_000223 [Purpureocillium takamizusanense]UNI13480.1 hypothetical protein JDV02_000223 [Purpureocillium takamizusanense]
MVRDEVQGHQRLLSRSSACDAAMLNFLQQHARYTSTNAMMQLTKAVKSAQPSPGGYQRSNEGSGREREEERVVVVGATTVSGGQRGRGELFWAGLFCPTSKVSSRMHVRGGTQEQNKGSVGGGGAS